MIADQSRAVGVAHHTEQIDFGQSRQIGLLETVELLCRRGEDARIAPDAVEDGLRRAARLRRLGQAVRLGKAQTAGQKRSAVCESARDEEIAQIRISLLGKWLLKRLVPARQAGPDGGKKRFHLFAEEILLAHFPEDRPIRSRGEKTTRGIGARSIVQFGADSPDFAEPWFRVLHDIPLRSFDIQLEKVHMLYTEFHEERLQANTLNLHGKVTCSSRGGKPVIVACITAQGDRPVGAGQSSLDWNDIFPAAAILAKQLEVFRLGLDSIDGRLGVTGAEIKRGRTDVGSPVDDDLRRIQLEIGEGATRENIGGNLKVRRTGSDNQRLPRDDDVYFSSESEKFEKDQASGGRAAEPSMVAAVATRIDKKKFLEVVGLGSVSAQKEAQ